MKDLNTKQMLIMKRCMFNLLKDYKCLKKISHDDIVHITEAIEFALTGYLCLDTLNSNEYKLLSLQATEKCLLGYLKDKKYFKSISNKNISLLEDAIGRALQEYTNLFDSYNPTDNDLKDRIKLKEKEIEINMTVRKTDIYEKGYFEYWKNSGIERDEQWLNEFESLDDVLKHVISFEDELLR